MGYFGVDGFRACFNGGYAWPLVFFFASSWTHPSYSSSGRPFVSYTIVSWSLLTTRNACLLFGCHKAAAALRFPSLVQNTVTVVVWWFVLVPAIYFTLPPDNAVRRGFIKFNKSPFLINVHLLNAPLALADTLLPPFRVLTAADLWLSMALAMLYCLFYLLVLDRSPCPLAQQPRS